jgi:siroheme synthase-like protein
LKVYPVFLVGLASRRTVVLGGGREAERKVAGLVECDASVVVISRKITVGLRRMVRERGVGWIRRDYRPGDLRGAFLVISAREERGDAAEVEREANEVGALLNVVDDAPHCSFIAGSIVRRGELTVAISTAGAAPAVAVRLRERLERELGHEYAEFLRVLAALREPLAEIYPDFEERRRIWYRLVDSDVLELMRTGRAALALARVAELIRPPLEASSGSARGADVASCRPMSAPRA